MYNPRFHLHGFEDLFSLEEEVEDEDALLLTTECWGVPLAKATVFFDFFSSLAFRPVFEAGVVDFFELL